MLSSRARETTTPVAEFDPPDREIGGEPLEVHSRSREIADPAGGVVLDRLASGRKAPQRRPGLNKAPGGVAPATPTGCPGHKPRARRAPVPATRTSGDDRVETSGGEPVNLVEAIAEDAMPMAMGKKLMATAKGRGFLPENTLEQADGDEPFSYCLSSPRRRARSEDQRGQRDEGHVADGAGLESGMR